MKIISYLLDLLFPPSHSKKIVNELAFEDISGLSRQRRMKLSGVGVTALLSFKDSRVRALIFESRYRNNKKAQKLLAQLLAAHVRKISPLSVVLIPIPLSATDRKSKKFDSVKQIVHAALELKVPNAEINTQILVSSEENAFKIKNAPDSTYLYIVLGDLDWTGLRFKAAKEALEAAGVSHVAFLLLAH